MECMKWFFNSIQLIQIKIEFWFDIKSNKLNRNVRWTQRNDKKNDHQFISIYEMVKLKKSGAAHGIQLKNGSKLKRL